MTIKINIKGQNFIVSIPPKCGSTSLFRWLYLCSEGKSLTGNHHNGPLKKKEVAPNYKEKGAISIAVHRNGFERILSGYKHYVLDQPETEELKLNYKNFDLFARDMPILLNSTVELQHHMKHQARFLGTQWDNFDIVCPTSLLCALPKTIERIVCANLPEIKNENKREREISYSQKTKYLIRTYCAYDDFCGWNGKTGKGLLN